MAGSLNLTAYSSVKQSLFIKMVIPDYGTLRMSNHDTPYSLVESGDTFEYTPMGALLAVSEFNNELRPSQNDITISLAAIDQAFIAGMMGYAIKGSEVVITRVFFNANTGVALNIAGNPSARFVGIIANYSFNDEYNQFSQTASTTISVSCSSIVTVLTQKIAGQFTNNAERKYNYPGSYVTATIPGGTGFQFRVLTTGTNGAIATIGDIIAGSGYTNGTYTNLSLINITGSGINGKISVTVSGGVVTSVTVTTAGTGYRADDAGFSRVAAIATSNFDFGKPLATA